MGFTSFAGRVLFASVFLLSAWREFNEFGVDGGPAGEAFKPKFKVFTKHVDSQFGVHIPEIEMRHIVAGAIALKGIGGILFIFGSSLGAYLLVLHLAISTPILCDFYNYDIEKIEFLQLFIKFTQISGLLAMCLFVHIEMHEFGVDGSYYNLLKNLALFGALLFFLGMKNSIPRRHLKKKAAPKTKTV